MMNICSNIVKRMIFSSVFLTLITVHVSAQDSKSEKKVEGMPRWYSPVLELKIPSADTSGVIAPDSLLQKRGNGITSIEIPNAYRREVENSVAYKMPIVGLSGKNCAPMPGTEKLDQMENSKKLAPKLKVQPLLTK